MLHPFSLGRFVSDYRDVYVLARGRQYSIRTAVTCRLGNPVGIFVPTRELLSLSAGSILIETRTSSFCAIGRAVRWRDMCQSGSPRIVHPRQFRILNMRAGKIKVLNSLPHQCPTHALGAINVRERKCAVADGIYHPGNTSALLSNFSEGLWQEKSVSGGMSSGT
jgi:hypothetical protein